MEKSDALSFGGNETTHVGPDVHDARLLGVVTLPSKEVRLTLQLVDGAEISLLLHGVERLRVNNFREGNIILDVDVSRGHEISSIDVACAYGLENEVRPAVLEQALSKIIAQNLVCVKVSPSFGAEVTCICVAIEFEPGAAKSASGMG